MKPLLLIILAFVTLASFYNVDIRGPWIKTERSNIILYTRPANHSKTASPDSVTINNILLEQEKVVDYINKYLGTNFHSKFEIYLFNFDEAREKIGTNGGGSYDSKRKRIYFTFTEKPCYNTYRDEYEYVGVHESVHLISGSELGYAKTRFFGEGYSNAIDGNYGVILIDNKLTRYRIDSTLVRIKKSGKVNTPEELLYNDNIPANLYYPQIGCLMKWLFAEYGVDKMNKLYVVKKKYMEKEFLKVTGQSFKSMEKKYLNFLQYQK